MDRQLQQASCVLVGATVLYYGLYLEVLFGGDWDFGSWSLALVGAISVTLGLGRGGRGSPLPRPRTFEVLTLFALWMTVDAIVALATESLTPLNGTSEIEAERTLLAAPGTSLSRPFPGHGALRRTVL